ncbi:hypothetical protein FQZ97_1057850 [compost metagenome]
MNSDDAREDFHSLMSMLKPLDGAAAGSSPVITSTRIGSFSRTTYRRLCTPSHEMPSKLLLCSLSIPMPRLGVPATDTRCVPWPICTQCMRWLPSSEIT